MRERVGLENISYTKTKRGPAQGSNPMAKEGGTTCESASFVISVICMQIVRVISVLFFFKSILLATMANIPDPALSAFTTERTVAIRTLNSAV